LDIRWKMGDFQQRAGLTGIANLNFNAAHRQTLSGHYADLLRRHDWPACDFRDGGSVTLLRYPLQVENKKDLLMRSAKAGIELGSWFETPLHPLALDEHHLIHYKLGSCPVAESTADRVINLPLHERVSRIDADRIANFVLSNSAPAAS
jgi:dTDP-4-amino-4,6-dideoxygalactose transaminase